MNTTERSFITAALTACVICANIGGALVRDHLKVGVPSMSATSTMSRSLYASADDKLDIPEGDYFVALTELLKSQYVDRVTDENKLASGAVRGMIASLADPLSYFMSAEQFEGFIKNQRGVFEGIGIEIQFKYDQAELDKLKQHQKGKPVKRLDQAALIPKVVVVAVAPESPAAVAGMQPGDRIDSINDRWVMSTAKIHEFRAMNKELRTKKSDPAERDKKLHELQEKIKNGLTPAKARDLLTLGVKGEQMVTFERKGQLITKRIGKSKTVWPALAAKPDGSYSLKLFKGASDHLKPLLVQKSLTLDLRNSTLGDYSELSKCLALLAPSGTYGYSTNERGDKPVPITVKSGNGKSAALTLIVDQSTRGASEILALALSSKGKAKLKGQITSGEKAIVKVSSLPDGSGYVLATGKFSVKPTVVSSSKKS